MDYYGPAAAHIHKQTTKTLLDVKREAISTITVNVDDKPAVKGIKNTDNNQRHSNILPQQHHEPKNIWVNMKQEQ